MNARVRLRLMAVGLLFIAMCGGVFFWLSANRRVTDFQVVVSRTGMQGEPATYWTISSTGAVLRKAVNSAGETTTTSATLKVEDIRRIEAALANFEEQPLNTPDR